MTITSRKLRPLAALATVALIGAGCSNGSAGNGDDDNSSGTGDHGTAVRFAECMREHGVPHFPDPDAKGEFNFGVDVTPVVFRKAVDACKDLKPPGALSAKRTPKQQSASLEFAQCIREHGVKDFPDPVNGEPVVDTTKIPSTDAPGGMTILNAAMQKCGAGLKKAAGGQR